MFGIETRPIFLKSFNYKTYRNLIVSPLFVATGATFFRLFVVIDG